VSSFYSKGEKFRVFRADCREVMKDLPEQSAHFVFMDPPYNLDEYCTLISFQDREDLSKTAEWDRDFDPAQLVDPLKRVLDPRGNVFAFTSFNVFGRWFEVFNPLYDTFQFMAWHKTNPPTQVRKTSFLNAVEQIVCFWNSGHKWNFTTQNGMHNFIESPICMGHERVKDSEGNTLHPTQKPLKALRNQILWCTDPGDTILDPYGGVFSIGVAALEAGRRYVGVELDPTYYEAGLRRLEEVAEKPSVEQCLLRTWEK